jgi:hypothetical protein
LTFFYATAVRSQLFNFVDFFDLVRNQTIT